MARPVKKPPEQWREAILAAAKELFLEKGFEAVSVAEIMARARGAKGMFYRCFGSKEELMQALGDRAFLENNPFDAVRERRDLNGLEKMRLVLELFKPVQVPALPDGVEGVVLRKGPVPQPLNPPPPAAN